MPALKAGPLRPCRPEAGIGEGWKADNGSLALRFAVRLSLIGVSFVRLISEATDFATRVMLSSSAMSFPDILMTKIIFQMNEATKRFASSEALAPD